MWRRIRRTGIGLGILIFSLGLLFFNYLGLAPQGRAMVKSAFFVTQVLPISVKPQEWVTSDSIRESVEYALPGGNGSADIYRIPDDKERAGVVVFLGVNPAPRDDERVVNLGHGLARAGFVVMFPWSPTMFQRRISTSEPDNLVWAFDYLRGLDYVDPERVGMGGFCVGASIALVAASDPRISEDVDFISSFGGYYDVRDLLAQIASRSSFYGRAVDPWDPRRLTEEVFMNQLIEGLEDEAERKLLTRIFVERGAPENPALPDELSVEGDAVYKLVSSASAREGEGRLTLEEADRLLGKLPPRTLDDFGKISPSASIDNLKARVLIAHDREDDAVPSEESKRLADALSERGDVHHTEFSFFSHVTPDRRVGPFTFVKEAFKLLRYTYSMVRLAT